MIKLGQIFMKYFFLSLPYTIMFSFLIFTIYWMCIRENLARNRIRREINKEIVAGNKVAIAIKKECYSIDWQDENLVMEALKGNESAIKALRVKLE